MKKILQLTALFTGLLLIGAGCVLYQQSRDTNLVTNANTANTNVVMNTNENANTDVANENINTEQMSDVNTSGWEQITVDELGLSILLPVDVSESIENYRECGVDTTCEYDGYSYIFAGRKGSETIANIGSVSKTWSPKTEGMIYDVYNLDNSSEDIKVIYANGAELTIHPIKTVTVASKTVYVFDPLKDYYTDTEYYNPSTLEPAYAAIIPLSSEKYKAAIMYAKNSNMSLDELITSIKTIEFLN